MSWVKRVWRKYVASVGWPLNAACLIAVLVVILHDFVFVGWPELFPHGAQLWKLAYQLSLALIASYVFFYVNVHIRRLREKEALRPFLCQYTRNVVEQAAEMSRTFKGKKGKPEYRFEGDFPPTLEDTERMLLPISPKHTIPFVVDMSPDRVKTYGTWLDWLLWHKSRTMHSITRIYTATPFLEPEHLRLIMDVENCEIFDLSTCEAEADEVWLLSTQRSNAV
jgi:hypothetical protein